jgi:hypothetical protein
MSFTESNTVERMILAALSSRSSESGGALVLREDPPGWGTRPHLPCDSKSGFDRDWRSVYAGWRSF